VSAYGERNDYFTKPVGMRKPVKKAEVGKSVCFGIIGNGGKVCMANCVRGKKHCGTSSHGNKKYVPMYDDGFYVPCKSKDLLHKPVAYFEPSIGLSRLTPEYEVAFLGTNSSAPPVHTSYEWCVLIEEANQAFDRSQRELQGNYEGSDAEEEEDYFEVRAMQLPRDYEGTSLAGEIPHEVEYDTEVPQLEEDDGYADALLDTRRVLSGVVENLHKIARAIPLEGKKAASHLVPSVEGLIDTMNRVVQSLRDVSDAVGDRDQLVNEGYTDVVEAILSHKSEDGLVHPQAAALVNLEAKVDDMMNLIGGMDSEIQELASIDHVNSAILAGLAPLATHVSSMLRRLTQVEGRGAVSYTHLTLPTIYSV